MNRPSRLLIAALSAALATPAAATNGMRMIGFSPTQNAMGGVGVGATLDAGAVITNPAGLTELGRRLDLSLTWFKPSVEYKATGAPLPQGAFVMQPDTTIKSDRAGSPIPNVGAVIPLGGGLTAGIGAFGVGGMGVDYKANLYGGKTLTSYLNLRVAPAIAYKTCEWFSVGLALNASLAQMKYDVASGFGQQLHDTASSFGYGATLGVKLHPSTDVAVGAAYETKSTFQDFSFDVPAHQAPDGAGGTVSIPAGTDKLKFDQPAMLSGGVSWRVLPILLVAADVQWINWSDVMGKGQPKFQNMAPNGYTTTGAMPFDMSWDDQMVFKAGAEVQATPTIKLRAGFDYGKNPLKADRAFENVAFPAVAETHVTAGLGWDVMDSLAVNVAGMYAGKASIKGANAAYPNTGGQGLTSYETSMTQWSVDLGVGWKF